MSTPILPSESRIAEIRANLDRFIKSRGDGSFVRTFPGPIEAIRDLLAHIDALNERHAYTKKLVEDEAVKIMPIAAAQRLIRADRERYAALSANKKAVEALEQLAKQKLATEMDEDENFDADFEDAYEEIVKHARKALKSLSAPSQPETPTGAEQDRRIRDTVALIADYVSPEGLDPEEWGQLCKLAEKILRLLKLWQPETPKTGE